MSEHLLNAGEVADVLGITRRAATKLARRDDFPAPVAWTAGPRGPMRLWHPREIAEWEATAKRRDTRRKEHE
jgi:hypothetical protein